MTNIDNAEWETPTGSPDETAAIGAISLDEAGPKPEIASPPSGFVTLPGVWVDSNGLAQRNAQVQELTGEHEEIISRAQMSGSIVKFMDAIVSCGTVSVGNTPAKGILPELLTADQDFLLMEIRRMTYGPDMEFKELTCPWCKKNYDLSISIDDIPVTTLDNPDDAVFDVALRNGKTATVRMVTGADRVAITADDNLTLAERNTLLMSRCVLSLVDAKGERTPVAGQADTMRKMSLADRKSIMDELAKRQVGPHFEDTSFTHDECGKEVPFPIGIGELFPGM